MRFGIKNLSLIVKYIFMTPWCPANKLEWYRVIILSVHTSEPASTAVSFSGVILNNNESNKIYHSANVSTLQITDLELGNYFVPGKCPSNGDCLNSWPVFL